jgi:para-aminobenzoate synthetase
VTDNDVTVGVGGAIIDLSDPQSELDEMILKSAATVGALSESEQAGVAPTMAAG